MKNGAPIIGIYDAGERWQPGGRPGRARRLRRDLLPQRHGLRRGAADRGHHGPVRRRGGLLAGADRLHPHGARASSQLFLTGPEAARTVLGEADHHRGTGRGQDPQREERRRSPGGRRRGRVPRDDPRRCSPTCRRTTWRTCPGWPAATRPIAWTRSWRSSCSADADDGAGYDMREVVDAGGRRRRVLRDAGRDGRKNLMVGFARLNGRAVGVVANQPAELDGRLDIDAADQGRAVRALLRRVQHPAAHLRRHARVRARQGAGARRAASATPPSCCTPSARRRCPS